MAKIESQSWTVLIPDDWSDNKSDDNEQLYFESADCSKGFYISTYINSENKLFDLKDIESNLNIDKKHTGEIEGYRFKILDEKLFQDQSSIIGILDSYDQMKRYRIYIKYIAKENRFVRISYHDYDCDLNENSDITNNFIIDSLELK